jgi:hypothetical protein
MAPQPKRRFVVSDLGFAFAVHDTSARQEYAFEAGKGKAHKSSNALNSRRVELFPTREEALRAALRLNQQHEAGTLGW